MDPVLILQNMGTMSMACCWRDENEEEVDMTVLMESSRFRSFEMVSVAAYAFKCALSIPF